MDQAALTPYSLLNESSLSRQIIWLCKLITKCSVFYICVLHFSNQYHDCWWYVSLCCQVFGNHKLCRINGSWSSTGKNLNYLRQMYLMIPRDNSVPKTLTPTQWLANILELDNSEYINYISQREIKEFIKSQKSWWQKHWMLLISKQQRCIKFLILLVLN